MAHIPTRVNASGPPAASSGSPALSSDTVVFSHTKAPSRQSGVVAGTVSPAGYSSRQPQATLVKGEVTPMQPQLKKFRVEAPRGNGVRRMKVRVTKFGDKLGFGVRHDRYKRLQVSTLQGGNASLQVGDTLLSVNGVDLTGLEFLAVIQHLKATRPGILEFEIERVEFPTSAGGATSQQHNGHRSASVGDQTSARSPHGATSAAPAAVATSAGASGASQAAPVNPWGAALLISVPAASTGGPAPSSPACWPQKAQPGRIIAGYPPVPQTGVPPPSIPVTTGGSMNGGQQPRKRARPAQRAVTMLDDNGQPVNVTALMADLKKEREEKAALEEKNTGLRKRLQRMLIENDEVRVRAKNEVAAAQEKTKREVTEAQNQLAAARAQLRLQDRAPDVGRIDSLVNELTASKAQIERLMKAEAERTEMLTARYRGECRIAAVDAQRVLDSVVAMFRTNLRQVGRIARDNTKKYDLEVECDGVRRLAFMKLFSMAHDFTFYASAAFHSQEPVRHKLEEEQFIDLFGHALCHEERAGLFYVAIAPMLIVFDPSAETLVLKCQWAEQNTLRELARNFRF
ncbi:hypothetical protein PF005_g18393 [Phytophthora fragariae]|uniref:PDZ domain-containing protein n=1 Tax=Phytophthora fragariae TaxID=53985 RepID=A0A6A3EA19_9STRA|nr:hypothetical protein PF003_g13191 [Phytophthora fragariae]KAE8930544.1 hypothetical protein PF009_g19367 [Phytophthora fragariae]KAE8993105.1 hypothetical protein PF011_g17267 [Phytophthora fragariae]KAE9092355.1 hypothetical protein PF010_g17839 [Phytophthora fragariae]KAE9092475.1 hypothetical protein PF007_g18482 [Phytophthora fragariae]